MSIIVYGVNKPSRCRNCPFCIATDPDSDDSSYECVINQYLHWATWTDVPDFISEGCKIGGIPTSHGDLIDKQKLLEQVGYESYSEMKVPLSTLMSAPVVIEAEQGDG